MRKITSSHPRIPQDDQTFCKPTTALEFRKKLDPLIHVSPLLIKPNLTSIGSSLIHEKHLSGPEGELHSLRQTASWPPENRPFAPKRKRESLPTIQDSRVFCWNCLPFHFGGLVFLLFSREGRCRTPTLHRPREPGAIHGIAGQIDTGTFQGSQKKSTRKSSSYRVNLSLSKDTKKKRPHLGISPRWIDFYQTPNPGFLFDHFCFAGPWMDGWMDSSVSRTKVWNIAGIILVPISGK